MGLEQYVAFDAATASSTYSAGNLVGSPAFTAQQALGGGSGYWLNCCFTFYVIANRHHVTQIACEVFRWRPWEDADGNMDRSIELAAQCFGLKD